MIQFCLRSISTTPLLLGLIVATVIGCSGGTSTPPQVPKLRGVLTLYTVAEKELGHPVRSEEEIKKFAQERGAKVLERFNVSSVDELLISGRDGKPYVIIYGPPPSKEAEGIVAYESEGVDGKREVAYTTGEIRELNAEEIAALGL